MQIFNKRDKHSGYKVCFEIDKDKPETFFVTENPSNMIGSLGTVNK